MFQTIGRIAHQRRRSIIAIWAVLFVVGMALAGSILSRLTAQPDGNRDVESFRVADQLHEISGHGPSVLAVVDGTSDEVHDSVLAAVGDLAAVEGVVAVHDPFTTGNPAFTSTDGTSSLVVVEVDGDLGRAGRDAVVRDVVERLRAIDAPVKIGGTAVLDHEFETAVEKDLAAEQKALPIAFVAMIVILGGLIAAGLPIIIAFAAVAGAMFVLMAATGVMDVSIYAMNVVFMFGIGLGIDYGLLMVSRFREERAHGASVAEAVEATVTTAGRTVAFSALTVAAALAGLFAFDDPTFRSFGVAGIGVVLAALVAAVTLLPALLAVFGKRIKPKKAGRDGYRFFRLARFVQRRAIATVGIVGGALIAVAVPFLSARFETGDARSLPRSSEARAVAMTLNERFPARGADPIQVVAGADPANPAVVAYVETLRAIDGVAAVDTWQHTPAGMTVIELVPAGTSQSDVAQRIVRELRADRPAFGVEVGGAAAFLIDQKAETLSSLPMAFAIIALATFVLLFLMTGSIVVPIKAIVMNILSLGATFGALVWGFQEGHLSGLLGFESVGSLDLMMPVLIFIFAFGLSMDYEVFLLARVKEIYDETGDNDYAVAAGVQRTGGIITSAAMLIVLVFAGFAMGEVLGIKMLGFGLALAVVVDAAVVRTLLVPATMKLMGDWNWWAPAPLRRFHQRFGLHEAPSRPVQVAAEPEPVLV
jgi:RND superfamily putative drug exporter